VGVAAVNGPGSLVLSGAAEAVEDVAAHFRGEGRKVTSLRVSHAFHSPLMEPMLADFREVAESLTYCEPRIPLVSTLTGTAADPSELMSPDYWVQHVRRPVRYADGIRTLDEQGVSCFVELGPDGTLTALAQACLDADADADERLFLPSLRRDRSEAEAALTVIAGLFVRGGEVDWRTIFAGSGARTVPLPTYAFQRRTYWPTPAPAGHGGDISGLGLTAAGHPLLGAAVTPADSEGVLFTGRLSLRSHPWLRDHVVAGSVLFPGTGFLELVLHGAEQAGCDRVEELTIAVPLVLTEDGGVQVQVLVNGPDETGSRAVSVFSRPDGGGRDEPWTLHATGMVGTGAAAPGPEVSGDFEVWPPRDAVAEPVEGVYERLAALGLAYGPAFRGLRGLWRRGEEVFAEVALTEAHGDLADHFGMHPALLDSVLHAALHGLFGTNGPLRLPFSWSGVSLWAAGATELRVRVAASGPDVVTLELADAAGGVVAAVDSLVLREVADDLAVARDGRLDNLYQVDWVRVPAGAGPVPETRAGLPAPGEAVLGDVLVRVGRPADNTPSAVHALTVSALALVREWLGVERFAGARLVVVTEGAVAPEGVGADPVLSAVWGVVRAARAEAPGRLVLLDVDGGEESWSVVGAALASSEPELAVRGGVVYVPRLGRVSGAGALTAPGGESAWRL
ncbi:polyketide synthase dehydratase domain-containing protein, partial [Streptomyces bungoensis]